MNHFGSFIPSTVIPPPLLFLLYVQFLSPLPQLWVFYDLLFDQSLFFPSLPAVVSLSGSISPLPYFIFIFMPLHSHHLSPLRPAQLGLVSACDWLCMKYIYKSSILRKLNGDLTFFVWLMENKEYVAAFKKRFYIIYVCMAVLLTNGWNNHVGG